MDAGSIRVITGPTAAGKSTLAMLLAERYGADIISADSRQLYRGFDLGTAKPTAAEQARVPHHCIDLSHGEERTSAAMWSSCAQAAITHCVAAGRTPMVVGGTGFYIRALFHPLFPEPELDPIRRSALQQELVGLSLSELRRWCTELDPLRSHLGRSQLLRAIEVALLTGRRISTLYGGGREERRWRPRYLVVDPGADLQRRIVERVHEMLQHGWEREVGELMLSVSEEAPAWTATGYMVVRDIVRGAVARDEGIQRVVISTRQYAKRQRTWLRNQLGGADVTMLNPAHPGALAEAMKWWEQGESD